MKKIVTISASLFVVALAGMATATSSSARDLVPGAPVAGTDDSRQDIRAALISCDPSTGNQGTYSGSNDSGSGSGASPCSGGHHIAIGARGAPQGAAGAANLVRPPPVSNPGK